MIGVQLTDNETTTFIRTTPLSNIIKDIGFTKIGTRERVVIIKRKKDEFQRGRGGDR